LAVKYECPRRKYFRHALKHLGRKDQIVGVEGRSGYPGKEQFRKKEEAVSVGAKRSAPRTKPGKVCTGKEGKQDVAVVRELDVLRVNRDHVQGKKRGPRSEKKTRPCG